MPGTWHGAGRCVIIIVHCFYPFITSALSFSIGCCLPLAIWLVCDPYRVRAPMFAAPDLRNLHGRNDVSARTPASLSRGVTRCRSYVNCREGHCVETGQSQLWSIGGPRDEATLSTVQRAQVRRTTLHPLVCHEQGHVLTWLRATQVVCTDQSDLACSSLATDMRVMTSVRCLMSKSHKSQLCTQHRCGACVDPIAPQQI